jgi:hypothetical protein
MGGLTYSFFLHYTRAAATHFLASVPNGPKPSPFWPDARSSVATALDWLATPAKDPVFPQFELTPRQAHVAEAFAAFAFRFALCHEMAHVVLDHLDAPEAKLTADNNPGIRVFRATQQQELDADNVALRLQMNSLPDPSQHVTALASSIYFIHITGLLVGRLMLLAPLVDHTEWKIRLTHPPALQRVLNLMGAAQAFGDKDGAGLQSVHGSLADFNGEIYDTANKQQESVANDAARLLATSASSAADELRTLFHRSPIGVLRALEPAATNPQLEALKEQFASTLPSEFREFRSLPLAQRAKKMA